MISFSLLAPCLLCVSLPPPCLSADQTRSTSPSSLRPASSRRRSPRATRSASRPTSSCRSSGSCRNRKRPQGPSRRSAAAPPAAAAVRAAGVVSVDAVGAHRGERREAVVALAATEAGAGAGSVGAADAAHRAVVVAAATRRRARLDRSGRRRVQGSPYRHVPTLTAAPSTLSRPSPLSLSHASPRCPVALPSPSTTPALLRRYLLARRRQASAQGTVDGLEGCCGRSVLVRFLRSLVYPLCISIPSTRPIWIQSTPIE